MQESHVAGPQGGNSTSKGRNDVGCLRRCKRSVRRRVGWNTCPMRYQLRVHLFTLFGCFFAAFFIFLFLYAKYVYQQAVVANLSTEWSNILEDRLVYSSQAVSTAFYMSDKAFIDTTLRLKALYQEASKDPFPVRVDSYESITAEELSGGKVIYGRSAYCNFEDSDDEAMKPVKRLHQVWEQGLLRRLGHEKNVNGHRILILYTKSDNECVYPAQLFSKKEQTALSQKQALLTRVLDNDKEIYVERDVGYLYDSSEDKSYTNYWTAITDVEGEPIGVIGVQFDNELYFDLIPKPVIEEPYSLSLINLYDSELKTVWHWGCTDCTQDHDQANIKIEELFSQQGNKYVQWKEPKSINLDPDYQPQDESDDKEKDEAETQASEEKIMKIQNDQSPILEVSPHKFYDPEHVMYVVVGHSAALKYTMNEKLADEIARGLLLFMLSLLGGLAACFIIFSYCFEVRLQKRVTKPISELSKQIRNPKEFMAARSKAVDLYTRKNTILRKNTRDLSRNMTTRSSTESEMTNETSANALQTISSMNDTSRGSSMGRTEAGKMLGGTEFQRQREQDEKMAKYKTINEVQALRGVFYNFFEMKDEKNGANDKVLVSMQVAEADFNPFLSSGAADVEDNGLDTSSRMYAYSTNMSGIFDHLQKFNQRREQDPDFEMIYQDSRGSFQSKNLEGVNMREVDLDIIEERPGDETDQKVQRMDSSEIVVDEQTDGVNKPLDTLQRRATIMTEFTEAQMEMDSDGSDEFGRDEIPHWVDQVKLRHGMDWLDFIKLEVDRDTHHVESLYPAVFSHYSTQKTEPAQ